MIHWYSISTDLKPDWPTAYATKADIQGYLLELTSKYLIRSHCVFNTSVVSAEWDKKSQKYHLVTENTKNGQRKELTAKIVVAATGILCEPNMPAIPGLDGFEGNLFHSARWRHDVPLAGKRVAVLGNGSSG